MNIDHVKRQQQPVVLQGVTRRMQPDGSRGQSASGDAVLDNINSQDLVDKLKEMPEVRPDVVELGRKLANDPSYPPEHVIDQLAQILADQQGDWMDPLGEDFDTAS